MDKREKIIQTAIKLFVEQGFENTPTSQISQASGVATGTLFHHFKTKEDLLNESYLYVKRKMISAMQVQEDKSIKEKLKKSWTSKIEYGKKNPLQVKFTVLFSDSQYITKKTQSEGVKIFQPFTNIFQQGIKEKTLKALPQEILISTYYSILKGVFCSKNPDSKTISLGFEMAWDALKK